MARPAERDVQHVCHDPRITTIPALLRQMVEPRRPQISNPAITIHPNPSGADPQPSCHPSPDLSIDQSHPPGRTESPTCPSATTPTISVDGYFSWETPHRETSGARTEKLPNGGRDLGNPSSSSSSSISSSTAGGGSSEETSHPRTAHQQMKTEQNTQT
ncbi:hypothetical protein VTJ04DRAFT_530 [Mycothermus thermophilus]|uniref:uncharacterized protein n=1 Tax=Humicola insolens TaxID=85995 RepID=UPI003742B16E